MTSNILFAEKFGKGAEWYAESPGRINLIGEHIDYNGGVVMPAAINLSLRMLLGRSSQQKSQVYSQYYNEQGAIDELSWTSYIDNVLKVVQRDFGTIPSFNLYIGGNLPVGSGLSSSSALCCGLVGLLSKLMNLELTKLQIRDYAIEAEQRHGVQGGTMDQTAIIYGRQDHFLVFDTVQDSIKYLPFDETSMSIYLIHSMEEHDLIKTAFNDRRNNCLTALEKINRYCNKKYQFLSQCRKGDLRSAPLTSLEYMRTKFVIQEQCRVEETIDYFNTGDWERIGEKLSESHQGLAGLYQVSTKRMDFLVHCANQEKGILGTRMMGGGFGGCTINLVRTKESREALDRIKAAFYQNFGLYPEVYPVRISNGLAISTLDA